MVLACLLGSSRVVCVHMADVLVSYTLALRDREH
jgi:hypothetical protein